MRKGRLKLYLGGGIILALIVTALIVPLLPLASTSEAHIEEELQGVSPKHPLGQDDEGRDVLSRLLYGTRTSLTIAFSVALISMFLGVSLGLFAGYFGGLIDKFFVMLSDVFLAFPSILLIIAIAAFVPPSILNIIFVLSFVGWVSYARIARGQVLSLKQIEFIQSARSMGFSHFRILRYHILPNILAPIIINATLSVAGIIIAESTLSFLGIGVEPGTPSWGSMLDAGVANLIIAPHLSIFPGLAIMITVLAFNFFGDGLRDYYDVREMGVH